MDDFSFLFILAVIEGLVGVQVDSNALWTESHSLYTRKTHYSNLSLNVSVFTLRAATEKQFGQENLLKPWSSSSQFLAAPQGPQGLTEVFWAPALSISDSCLGKVEADTPVFSSFLSLSRCQHLKVNNIQEGSGVRAASGLSLSPQTEPVRAWIWPVWSTERSWATTAPGLDTMSSVGAVTVTEKGAASWIPGSVLACRPRSVGLMLWRPLLSKADSSFAGAKRLVKWTHNPSLKIYGRWKRTGGLCWLTGWCPGVSRLGTTGTSYKQSRL